ncbi:MAG TPA: GAP family protein [Solirubrobacteraceae bacterium]|nr:GAP family protein [Solirubrobacteraceae bacterium]
MGHVAILALTASLNPTLLAATTMMLFLDRPARLMAGYLAGAFLTSVTIGLVIVFTLGSSSATRSVQHTVNPLVDIALGLLALVVALAIRGGSLDRLLASRKARNASKPAKAPPRWQRALTKGSPRVAFAIGAVLTLPGASTLVGLYAIHNLHAAAAVTVLIVIGFNVVMLWLLELPLVGYAVAPERTPQAVDHAKLMIARHIHAFAIRGLELVAFLLVLKGVIGLMQ